MINGRAFSFSRGRPTRFTDIYETAVWCSSNPSGNNDRSTRFLPSTFHDWSRNRLISNYCVEDGNARISLAITLAEIGREKRGLLDQRWLDESLVNSPSLNPLFPDRRSNRCAWAWRTEPHSRATDDSRFVLDYPDCLGVDNRVKRVTNNLVLSWDERFSLTSFTDDDDLMNFIGKWAFIIDCEKYEWLLRTVNFNRW